MAEETGAMKYGVAGIPADNLERKLVFAQPNADPKLVHIGVVGDTYTILLASKDTAGRFCLIDMHIPQAARLPTVTIWKKLSRCWRANWRLRFAAQSRSCAWARPFIRDAAAGVMRTAKSKSHELRLLPAKTEYDSGAMAEIVLPVARAVGKLHQKNTRPERDGLQSGATR